MDIVKCNEDSLNHIPLLCYVVALAIITRTMLLMQLLHLLMWRRMWTVTSWYGIETEIFTYTKIFTIYPFFQLREAGIVARLRDLLGNGQRQRYHATRGLVYMGELDLGSNNIFTDNDSSLEVDSVVLSTEDGDNGHSYARYVYT